MRSALALLCLSLSTAAAAQPPTRAALRKALEANRGVLVEVVGPHKKGTGVLVGAQGQVLTSVDFVGLYDAKVRFGGKELPARVLVANAPLRLAVVQISTPGEFPSAAVDREQTLDEGMWLLGIGRTAKGDAEPHVLQVLHGRRAWTPFIDVNAALAPGTPLFDAHGRLVALTVKRTGRSSRALPIPVIQHQIAQGSPP